MGAEVIVITGPTASGKTDLGVKVALLTDGEIISADSRQIYRYMDIGTAKPTVEERGGIPHHLIDIVDPDTPYNASAFAESAARLIEEIVGRGRQPIVVGGSGFYIEALFHGLSPIPTVPEEVKKDVAACVRSDARKAFRDLERCDPEIAQKLKVSDRQRISRALEVFASTGLPISHFQTLDRVPATTRRAIPFGLRWTRKRLYERINGRAIHMIASGLVEEVRALFERGYDREAYAMKTFGYREVGNHLAGELPLDDATTQIQIGSRHYAKRQLTWFRNRSRLKWLDPEQGDPAGAIIDALHAT